MSVEFIIAFVMTVFVVSIIPGPSMLLALTHGMQHGVKRSMASAAGNLLVTLLQAVVSLAGLGALLATSEAAFLTVKWAGAAYLLYMGINMIRQGPDLAAQKQQQALAVPLKQLFWQSVVVTAGNPKAIVFFAAVFPQFIDPTGSFVWQASVLTLLCMGVAFACFMLYVVSGERLLTVLAASKAGKYLNRVLGGTFVGSGVALALSSR